MAPGEIVLKFIVTQHLVAKGVETLKYSQQEKVNHTKIYLHTM